MAVRYFIDDTSDVLLSVTEDDDISAPSGQTAVAKSVIAAAYTGDIYQGGTWDGTTYTPPDGQGSIVVARKKELWRAYAAYNEQHRRSLWTHLRSGNNASDPLVATDKWVYHQIAMGDVVTDGTWPSSASDDDKLRIHNKILAAVTVFSEIWYRVQITDPLSHMGDWKGVAVASGSVIYTDLATSSGADRTMDGDFIAIPTTIPTNYNPEYPNLRNPA